MERQKRKQKLNQERGITLIALIVTIIILVILVAVSIRAAFNSGVIEYSVNGTQNYIEAKTEEESRLANAGEIIESVVNRLDEIVSGSSANEEDDEDDEDNVVPEELTEYISGKSIGQIWDDSDSVFINDPDSITDAETSVVFLSKINDTLGDEGFYYVRYNNAAYRITVEYINEVYEITGIAKVYEPRGVEGQIVRFKAKASDSNLANWLVLYDNGSTIDMVCVSSLAEDMLTLGSSDDFDDALYAYNHAVDLLNAEAASLVTNISPDDGEMVRSEGTRFGLPSDVELLEYPNNYAVLSQELAVVMGDYYGAGLKEDFNLEQDVVRHSYWASQYEEYSPIWESFYFSDTWFASRGLEDNGHYGSVEFSVYRECNGSVVWDTAGECFWEFYNGEPECTSVDGYVRPVVRVLKNSDRIVFTNP